LTRSDIVSRVTHGEVPFFELPIMSPPMLDSTALDRPPLPLPALHTELARSLRCTAPAATPASIHDLRIAAHRFQALVRALRKEMDPKLYRGVRAELRNLAEAAAPAREAYIRKRTGLRLLASAEKVSAQDAKQGSAALECALDLASIALSCHLRDEEHPVYLPRTNETLVWLQSSGLDSHAVQTLIRSRFERLLAQIDHGLRQDLKPRRLHALRIRVKNARYLAEMLDRSSGQQVSVAKQLRRTQDALGELHDMQQFAEWLPESPLPPTGRKELAPKVANLELRLSDRYRGRRKPLRRAITKYFAAA
jgi:CHAD domain-containing protein